MAAVTTSLGNLRGKILRISDKDVYSFTGVPYADKPERFELPKPCSKWNGTLNCTKESKLGYQPSPLSFGTSFLFKGSPEDCLYLNIFTPTLQTEELLPVIVFFHGGAFLIGGNNTKNYGPNILLSEHNVVLVTVNYRLGPFGFLNFETPECPGNQGMHDQVMSLRWVKSHIAHFGGNPSNITIMGQSAGGMSVLYHLVSPLSRGLFKKVLNLSGSVLCMPMLYNDERPSYYAKKFAASLGIPEEESTQSILDKLKSLPPKKILSKVLLFSEHFLINGSPWILHPDGAYMNPENSFLPDTFENLVRSRQSNPVDSILMGYTAQDGLCYSGETIKRPRLWQLIQQDWCTTIPMRFFNRRSRNVSEEDKSSAEKLFRIFCGEGSRRPLPMNSENYQNFEKLSTLLGFKLPFYATAKLLHEFGYTVYGYNFNFSGTMTVNGVYYLPAPKFLMNLMGQALSIPLFQGPSYGVPHGEDLLYIFSFKLPGLSKALTTTNDKMASKNFKGAILSFAHCGLPTNKLDGSGSPQWPPIFINDSTPRVALINHRDEEDPWEMDANFDEDTVRECFEMIKNRYNIKVSDN